VAPSAPLSSSQTALVYGCSRHLYTQGLHSWFSKQTGGIEGVKKKGQNAPLILPYSYRIFVCRPLARSASRLWICVMRWGWGPLRGARLVSSREPAEGRLAGLCNQRESGAEDTDQTPPPPLLGFFLFSSFFSSSSSFFFSRHKRTSSGRVLWWWMGDSQRHTPFSSPFKRYWHPEKRPIVGSPAMRRLWGCSSGVWIASWRCSAGETRIPPSANSADVPRPLFNNGSETRDQQVPPLKYKIYHFLDWCHQIKNLKSNNNLKAKSADTTPGSDPAAGAPYYCEPGDPKPVRLILRIFAWTCCPLAGRGGCCTPLG